MRREALHGDKPMIHPTQLPADVLAEIVSQIQQLLWLDAAGCGRSPDHGLWPVSRPCHRRPSPPGRGVGVRAILARRSIENGDKEWDCETLEYVAAVVEEYRLRPEGEEVERTVMVERTL